MEQGQFLISNFQFRHETFDIFKKGITHHRSYKNDVFYPCLHSILGVRDLAEQFTEQSDSSSAVHGRNR